MEVRYSNIVQLIPARKNRADLAENRAQQNSAKNHSAAQNSVSFQGVQNTMLRETMNSIDEIYSHYKTSLEEIPLKRIMDSVNTLKLTTGHDRKDILSAMQQLTNFSNIRSVREIAKVLERDNISCIFNSNKVFRNDESYSNHAVEIMKGNSGIHKTLEYLIVHKGFGNLDKFKTKKVAFFLDKKNIEALEHLKKECPDDFLKLINKDMRFYYLSGWDNGITFINRTKKLEAHTKSLLETSDKSGLPIDKVLDAQLLKRIHQLGISPNIISREGLPNEVCIYKRLAPEQMTKSELTNLVIANAKVRSKNASQIPEEQAQTADYLNSHLKVFTPESLSNMSVYLKVKVNNFAKEKGVEPKDILYVEPNTIKSNSLINHMYKTVNGIPDEQFITMSELVEYNKKLLKNNLLVFLDDCSITGNSINESIYMYLNDIRKEVPKLFVCYGSTANAKRVVNCEKNKKMNISIITGDYIPHVLTNKIHISNRKMEEVVGKPKYVQGEATCLVFPYMSPDTNTELASNIALLHNINYRLSNIMIPYKKRNYRYKQTEPLGFKTSNQYNHTGVKNYTEHVDNIAKEVNRLAGSEPVLTENNFQQKKENFFINIYHSFWGK